MNEINHINCEDKIGELKISIREKAEEIFSMNSEKVEKFMHYINNVINKILMDLSFRKSIDFLNIELLEEVLKFLNNDEEKAKIFIKELYQLYIDDSVKFEDFKKLFMKIRFGDE